MVVKVIKLGPKNQADLSEQVLQLLLVFYVIKKMNKKLIE